MKPTAPSANAASTSKTGLFATLRGLLHVEETGAPKITRGTGASIAVLKQPMSVSLTSVKLAVVSLSVLVLVSLAFTAAPALAAAPAAPLTLAPEGVKAESATFVGILLPMTPASSPVEGERYEFVYKPSTSEACQGGEAVPLLAGEYADEEAAYIELPVAGLKPATEYAVCLLARNDNGSKEATAGAPVSFTTAALPQTPETLPAGPVTPNTAVLHGVLDPKAAGHPGSYRFAYRHSTTECENAGAVENATPNEETSGSVVGEAVKAEITGLLADTTYTFCLLAENTGGDVVAGAPVTFRTPPEAFATDVTSSATAASVTLNAVLDPEGVATTYRFQYGESASYGAETPVEQAGEGTAPVTVQFHEQELLLGTTYHYRVLATSGGVTREGEDHTFTTPVATAAGNSALLDGRAWELVTPPNKQGSAITLPTHEGGIMEASETGGALTYISTGPVVEPQGNRALEYEQNIATREAGVWQSRDITTPNDDLGKYGEQENTEYKFFTSDLSTALLEPRGTTPLSELQEAGSERTVYSRDDVDNVFTPLVAEANVPSGVHFGGPLIVGASRDLNHVVVSSPQALTSEVVTPNSRANLFEWSAGKPPREQLQLVSVLPSGRPASEAGEGEPAAEAGLGREEAKSLFTENAVSPDGSLVVWETANGTGSYPLYLRDMTTRETVKLNTPEAGIVKNENEPEDPEFEGASGPLFEAGASGPSRVYFLDQERLTAGSHAKVKQRDLYVAEVHESPLSVTVTDLTPEGAGGETANVRPNVVGYGQDASGAHVYFAASGALAAGATPGECGEPTSHCNLYVDEYDNASGAWASRFIAALPAGDISDWGNGLSSAEAQTSRVSRDGELLVFMSELPLTGYDNRDVVSGARDTEVFLFDAATGGLRCVSCNPSGARPSGLPDPGTGSLTAAPLVVDQVGIFGGKWLAGSLPGWYANKLNDGVYQPRYLSDSGRVFFDSADALVPGDVNRVEDVYEYEPEGAASGTCDPSVGGPSEVYVRGGETQTGSAAGSAGGATAGCVGLISSGTGSEESAFVDANESGSDVFFLTSAQLEPVRDTDHAYDIYDAHECSEASPCPPAAGAVPPACTDADSCRAAPVAQPTVFGAPPTATFNGPGNAAPVSVPVAKPKSLTRAQKLASALKACKKKPKKQRAGCEAKARKSYGPLRKAKTKRRGKR